MLGTILSIIAISISFFSLLGLWWISIRNPKSFYLVVSKIFDPSFMLRFALVNGGNYDLLITSIDCQFIDKKNKGLFSPAQIITNIDEKDLLLQSKKGMELKIYFPEKFTEMFIKNGEKKNEFYNHELAVDITWIEMNGKIINKKIKILEYGFDLSGEIKSRKYLVNKANLYRLK